MQSTYIRKPRNRISVERATDEGKPLWNLIESWRRSERSGDVYRCLQTPTSTIKGIAKIRQDHKRNKGIQNQKISSKDPLLIETVGLIGEFAVAEYFSLINDEEIVPDLRLDPDPGWDLNIDGHQVDVKFSSYPDGDLIFTTLNHFSRNADRAILVVPYLDVSVAEHHPDYVPDREPYIDIWVQQKYPIVKIAGWIDRETFLADSINHSPDFDGRICMYVGRGMTQPSWEPRDCRQCAASGVQHHSPLNYMDEWYR